MSQKLLSFVLFTTICGVVSANGQEIPPAAEQPTSTQVTASAESFAFKMNECKKVGDRVICEVLITNNADERMMSIRGKRWGREDEGTRLIDDLGNVYNDAKGQFGAKELPYDEVKLVTDVPVKLILYFDGVSKEVSRIRLLELDCYTDEGDKAFTAKLRDIPLKLPPVGSAQKSSDSATPNSITTREFTFEALGCRRALTEVICLFRITNERTSSRTLTLRPRCYDQKARLIDQSGNEYLGTAGTLGTKKALPGFECAAIQTLDARARVDGSVTFIGVARDTVTVKLLRLLFGSSDESQGFYIDFKDIPITSK